MTDKINSIATLLIVIVVGLIIYYPTLHVLPYISEGDTGRDLYVSQMTLQGQVPYQDYHWNYGPLMPYYYALYFHLFGVKFFSVIIGRLVLNLACGVLIFLSLRLFFQPVFAALGAWWFWVYNQDFTYTFNHTGGVCLVLMIIYCLMRRISDTARFSGILISVALLLLMLVKLNIGLMALVATGISCVIIDRYHRCTSTETKSGFSLWFLIVPLITAAFIYYLLLKDVPRYFIFQCLPFLPGYEPAQASIMDAWQVFAKMIRLNLVGQASRYNTTSLFISPWPFQLMLILTVYSIISLVSSWVPKNENKSNYSKEWTALSIVGVFMLLLSHEFILSAVEYRLWWCLPLAIFIIFMMVGFMLKRKPVKWQWGLMILIGITIAAGARGKYLFKMVISQYPDQFLSMDRAKIYINNLPEWVRTLTLVIRRIQARVKEDETFLAVPYNPLYYFLTDHSAPIPELAFFDFLNTTEEQERRIIADLEQKNNNWLVLSNRAFSDETGLGYFGQSHCRLLAQYLKENYALVETIGDWDVPPGWIVNNAVKIYQKTSK